MSLAAFIRDSVLRPRLKKAGCLVVYDPARLYRDIVSELADEQTAVVDASQHGIESREQAINSFVGLARPGGSGPRELVIYVPASFPKSDHDRVLDPYAVYTACGSVFPDGDGDEYLSLCLKAKPDHASEIRRLFQDNPRPSFELVDNIGGGVGYPMLRTLLKVDSARNILVAMLAPSEQQKESLKGNESWVSEAKSLFQAALGLKLATKGKSWSAVADELWRFMLFSEFVLDLPGELPSSLTNVPHADAGAYALVADLCETLRNDNRTRQTYIDRAEQIEREIGLPMACAEISDLGTLDTFPFEERTFLHSAVKALKEDRLDDVRAVVGRHKHSVWLGKGESQAQWGLVAAALQLVAACEDADRNLAGHTGSLDALVEHYTNSLREIDRLQREFEQALGEYISMEPIVDDVAEYARKRYARIAEKVQAIFVKHLEKEGWPPQGRLANSDLFDKLVAPLLAERDKRVAYFVVDALRYELGLELQRQLIDTGTATIQAASAQLPTVTPIGMASLLPGAGKKLAILREGKDLVAAFDDQRLTSVANRMKVFEQLYGDRFAQMTLSEFNSGKKVKVSDAVNLLVIRSTEIDSHLENNPDTTLGLVHQTLKGIRVAIHRLKQAGFTNVVIATDHGFFLNGHADAGDICAKPSVGDWITVHDRALLGNGSADTQSFIMQTEKVGIRGDFECFGGPRSMAPYRRGLRFFHGGASLQEAVVPVITVTLQDQATREPVVASVLLSYKSGAKRITTRLPVVDLAVESADMFSQGADLEILLEAHDRSGKVVGEARKGDPVDPATGTLTLKPGQQKQVTIRMDMEFEGKFTLKAFNPVTMTAYASIDLETDYAV
ncbi:MULTISPECIES: PglZ domain-containing protein [unclassified Mesorhizobium]|uniref:PglZ domain-containing protein n=1 Tax=unclassified Mesorhizobium TaxID=325217 RepID=UPI0024161F7B|nr:MULTISPECIES: PglZ domain-containing protein [unclassified Mesorhizobium]MDG4901398.1 PglZ domain-containing protein [Mesorhizobium sp. WSM4962]MDG4918886.1 PglZ domain-containing protein [Mesorhizobium sp. WSM4989]